MEPLSVLKKLKDTAGLSEAFHITYYEGYRKTKKGGKQEISIKILDAGPESGKNRYTIVAELEDGRRAESNAAESIDMALSIVPWQKLD